MEKFLLALKIRSFLFLWLSELFSQIAMNMMNFILILVAFSLTNSNTAVSGIVLSFTLPAILFGILAGVYVDRWNKKNVLVSTNLLRFGLILVLAFAHRNLIMLYSLSFLGAIVTQFFIPAETPMIPLLVPKAQLLAANALFSMAWFGSVFVAYALSGPFLLFFGTTNALIVLSGIFLLAAICAMLIRLQTTIETTSMVPIPARSLTEEIKRAIQVIFKIRDVSHAFFLLVLVQVLTLIISVVGPGYARHILHININEFPLIFVTPAVIGMAVGAYLVTNYFHRFSRHKSATLGLFLGALVILLMPYAGSNVAHDVMHMINHGVPLLHITTLHIVISLAFLLGIANSFMFVPSNTLVQENTSDAVRGKVYGALNSISSLVSIIPIIVVGSFADIFGVGSVLTALGIVIGLIGVFRLAL